MADTKIEWCDKVWNSVTGCDPIGAGCAHCYAKRIAERNLPHWGNGRPFSAVRCHEDRLEEPLHWRKSQRIFTDSMGDLFHKDVPFEFVDRVFAVMALCPQHTFIVLTKRPERMREYLTSRREWYFKDSIGREVIYDGQKGSHLVYVNGSFLPWPLPNVILGVSICDQYTADKFIPILLQTPAARRGVSIEPMLGTVDLKRIDYRWQLRDLHERLEREYGKTPEEAKAAALRAVPEGDLSDGEGNPHLDVLTGEWFDGWDCGSDGNKLDWVICGGETGPGARPMHPDWVRSLRDQCEAAGVPFFFKQWGEWSQSDNPIEVLNRTTGDFETIPAGRGFKRVGKRDAGCLLDGQEWKQFPEVRNA